MKKKSIFPSFYIFKRLKIRQKLLFTFLFVIIVPLTSLTLVIYKISSDITWKNMQTISEMGLQQVASDFKRKMENMSSAASSLVYNNQVQEILTQESDETHNYEQIQSKNKLVGMIKGLENNEQGIYKVRIFVPDKLFFSKENTSIFSMETTEFKQDCNDMIKREDNIFWKMPYDKQYEFNTQKINVISSINIIKNYSTLKGHLGAIIGAVYVDSKVEDLQRFLQNYTLELDNIFAVVNEKGELVISSLKTLTETDLKTIKDLSLVKYQDIKGKRSVFQGEPMLFNSKSLGDSNWKIISVVPMNKITRNSVKLRNYSLLTLLALSFVAYGIAIYVSMHLSHRITELLKKMKEAQQGDLDQKVAVEGTDEIAEIQINFNRMLDNLKELMEERFRMGIEIKHAELRALQAQINPHFLYNTLELINWKASIYEVGEVDELIKLLAKFYKLSLSQGREVISISDEVEHVKTYLEIQNRRFMNGIKFKVEVEEEILKYSIPKLILQPIIENALLHGILEKPESCGEIILFGEIKKGIIHLFVKDDGIGISQEGIDRLMGEDIKNPASGYGIRNVKDRIRLFYGERYGVEYQSQIGVGTEVHITFPATDLITT